MRVVLFLVAIGYRLLAVCANHKDRFSPPSAGKKLESKAYVHVIVVELELFLQLSAIVSGSPWRPCKPLTLLPHSPSPSPN